MFIFNSFNNPSVGGIATYYYSKTGNDARLAQKVQNQIANVPGFNGDRGIQEGNLLCVETYKYAGYSRRIRLYF